MKRKAMDCHCWSCRREKKKMVNLEERMRMKSSIKVCVFIKRTTVYRNISAKRSNCPKLNVWDVTVIKKVNVTAVNILKQRRRHFKKDCLS